VSVRPCIICGGKEHAVLYHGPVRAGQFGSVSADPRTVWQCGSCGAGHLAAAGPDYDSAEYRRLVDGSDRPEDFHRLHDAEQAEKLRALGSASLRDAVLVDVGCGAGSFLDLVKGFCRTTIGIEPTPSLRAAVAAKGHQAFPYCADVPDTWTGRADVAVAFSLVEHVEDPLTLLRDIRRLLKPQGRLLISTPNRRDWLLDILPDEYAPFFYRTVHLWYFDAEAVERMMRIAGFTDITVAYHHRFDLSNAILWLRDKRPTGVGKLPIGGGASEVFRSLLEASGRADYLYGLGVRS
jgi:SAM-dependent methyltransferase